MSMIRRIELAVWGCLLLAASSLDGQVLYGSLTGNVTDPSGAAIPQASVEARSVGTGVARATVTDSRGVYTFNDVAQGTYKVSVAANGFQTMIENNVTVTVNEVRRVDFTTKLAQTSETVEVSASAEALQTDRADVHHQITSQELEELPYNGTEGKNFQALLLFEPGSATTAGTGEANSAAGN